MPPGHSLLPVTALLSTPRKKERLMTPTRMAFARAALVLLLPALVAACGVDGAPTPPEARSPTISGEVQMGAVFNP